MPALVPNAIAGKAELARRTLARRRLLYFTQQTLPGYQAGWVHDDICQRLERFSAAVTAKQSPRLMLLMPPRHGKSELASIRFPAWHLGHNPQHEIINVGYNLDLPMKFSRKVREVVRDPIYEATFPSCRLDPDSQSVEAWITTAGGGFTAAGRGGGITGKGAHVLIVDDPLKNSEEADSAVTRDSLWDWYLSTAYTRLSPGGGVLIIETWWNDDDLAGRVQKAGEADPDADQFEVVRYPALSESFEYRHPQTLATKRVTTDDKALQFVQCAEAEGEGYALIRQPGEALHPDRYDVTALRRIKATQSPRSWSALYQQNPVPDEGMYFRREYFQYSPEVAEPYNRHVYTAWDFAITEKQNNDWTVGATLIQDHASNLHVANVIRFKGDTFAIVEAILDEFSHWSTKPGVEYFVGVEDGQIWKTLEPVLRRRMSERKLYPLYEVLKPLTDKLVRARPLQGQMEQKRVWFPQSASWLDDVKQELMRFPAGKHDDIVDALAWAARLTLNRAPPTAPVIQVVKSWRDRMAEQQSMNVDGSHMAA